MVDMTDNEILGQRLQQCRESRKVTQQEMADAAGHSKNYISALEHGTNHNPRFKRGFACAL